MVTTKVDYRRAQVKIRKATRKAMKAGDETIGQLADFGKAHAKAIAPYFSGKTAKLIRVVKVKGSEGMRAEIISPNSTPGKRGFNLPRWMHATGGIFQSDNRGVIAMSHGKHGHAGQKHIINGDPRYMYRTADYLNRIKPGVAQANFNRVKI